jgi:hypothetical protein
MTHFAYTDEQRSRIGECLSSVIDKNPKIATWTSDGERLTPTASETAKRLIAGEIYEMLTIEEYFAAIVDDLEIYARSYQERIAENPVVTKKQLQRIATLCGELADALPLFSGGLTYVLGFAVSRQHFDEDTIVYSADSKKGEEELSALIQTLRSVENEISGDVFLVEPNASQRCRNNYLGLVLQTWLAAGGAVGGPNSAMISFFRAVCTPVLGNNPTDAALVKFAYALKDGAGAKRKLRVLKIKD